MGGLRSRWDTAGKGFVCFEDCRREGGWVVFASSLVAERRESGSSTSSALAPLIFGVDDALRLSLVGSEVLLFLVDRLFARLPAGFRSVTDTSSSRSLLRGGLSAAATSEYDPFFLCVLLVGSPFGESESTRPW